MKVPESQIIVIFVSTGRCGTKRLAEILSEVLPSQRFVAKHQVSIARLANVIGNIMYYLGGNERIKAWIWNSVLKTYAKGRHFIYTDPLLSMVVPRKLLQRKNTHVIQIVRQPELFAESFFRFSRGRLLSFIAHNFVPFWQIGIWPLENLFNKKIKTKYARVWQVKNSWFVNHYASFNYYQIEFEELFVSPTIERTIKTVMDMDVIVQPGQLKKRSNQSMK